MNRRAHLPSLAFVGALAWAAPAVAQPAASEPARPAEPTPEERALALIREGVELRREGREADAFERFRAAHEVHPTPRALGQMGLAAKSLRRYVDAAGYLDAALASKDDAWVAEHREALALARDIVEKQVARLLVRSNVASGELWINGSRVASVPMQAPVTVLAGALRVELRAPGFEPHLRDETLSAGAVSELEVDLTPVALPPAPSPDGGPPNAEPRGAPSEPEPARPLRPWIYTSLGIGGATLGVGTYFGIRAFMKKDERDAICPEPDCPTLAGVELDEDARASATASTVLVSVGSAGLVAAFILFMVELAEAPADAPTIAWRASPEGAFVGLAWALW